ncbi:MAG: hypothetical protein ACFFAQ_14695 [Promethearchaeota archaeon]
MSKRVYYIFAVLSIVLLSLTLQTFTPVVGLNVILTDPENDVYCIHYTESGQEISKGDFHDEIDIVKFEINEQTMNLTFAGNIADWQSSDSLDLSVETWAIILLHPDFQGFDIQSYPFYEIIYHNETIYLLDYRMILTYVTEFDEEYWDGSGWTSDINLAVDVGSASGKSIIANVSTDALNITEDLTFIPQSTCYNSLMLQDEIIVYADFAPNKYDPFASDDEIPSYNLFIVVGVLVGISLIIIKNQIKKEIE